MSSLQKIKKILIAEGEKQLEAKLNELIGDRDKAISDFEKNDLKFKHRELKKKCAQADADVKWLPRVRKRVIGEMQKSSQIGHLVKEMFEWFGKPDEGAEEKLSPDMSEAKGLALIKDEALVSNFITLKVRRSIDVTFKIVRGWVMSLIIKLMETVKELVLHPIVLAVGSIPYVGGILAVTVTILISSAFEFINHIIEVCIDKILDLILENLVKFVVKPLMQWWKGAQSKASEDATALSAPPTQEELNQDAQRELSALGSTQGTQWTESLASQETDTTNNAIVQVARQTSAEFQRGEQNGADVEDLPLPDSNLQAFVDKVKQGLSGEAITTNARTCFEVLGGANRDNGDKDEYGSTYPNCKCGAINTKYYYFAVKCGDTMLFEGSKKDGERTRFDVTKDISKLSCAPHSMPTCVGVERPCVVTGPSKCKGKGLFG